MDVPLKFGSANQGGVYAPNNTALLVSVRTFVAVVLNLRYYLITPEGKIDTATVPLSAQTADGSENIYQVPINEGILFSASLSTPDATLIRPGRCHGELGLKQAALSTGQTPEFMPLTAGPVSSMCDLVWPNTPHTLSTDSRNGQALVITNIDPAVGAEMNFVVPAHTRIEVVSIAFKLTTNVTGSNRTLAFGVNGPAGNEIASTYLATNVPASAIAKYTLAHGIVNTGAGPNATTLFINQAFPRLVLTAGSQFFSVSTNLQGTDTYTRFQITCFSWIDPGTQAGASGGGKSGKGVA